MTSRAVSILRFVTWNTRGIKNTQKFPQKRRDVLTKLDQIKTDIAFIQETHVGSCEKQWQHMEELEKSRKWRVFFTVHCHRSKGVAILIRSSKSFKYISHDEDYCGGYLVLFCRLYGELYTLVNVYNHKKDSDLLNRLKDYLEETAKGVLVVGGDFNTVIEPSFDRQSLTFNKTHSPIKANLKDFVASLNLRDTWSYLRPGDEGFTRCQNESQSRIDMFFTPKHTIRRVSNIELQSNIVEGRRISDHVPLVLDLRAENEVPKAFLALEKRTYTPDRKVGKINGAEILSAIKSLTDLGEVDQYDVAFYKKHRGPMAEVLKLVYNSMLDFKWKSEDFKLHHCFGNNVVYLILVKILANRLNLLIDRSFKDERSEREKTKRKETGEDMKKQCLLLTVLIDPHPQEITWSFLNKSIISLKRIHHVPVQDFRVLGSLLPSVQCTFGVLKSLQNGCPLTKPILNMTLKQLNNVILKNEPQFYTTVCFNRQALRIYGDRSTQELAVKLVDEFKEKSGIQVQIIHHFKNHL